MRREHWIYTYSSDELDSKIGNDHDPIEKSILNPKSQIPNPKSPDCCIGRYEVLEMVLFNNQSITDGLTCCPQHPKQYAIGKRRANPHIFQYSIGEKKRNVR